MLAWCPCFPSSSQQDDDREPLLPKHQQTANHHARATEPQLDSEPFTKFAAVLGALAEGKLPSQVQINHFLRRVLQSGLLRVQEVDGQGERANLAPDILYGNGPMSRKGRKVIRDSEEVVQALLQFGTEKNDDDLIQDLVYQLGQIDVEEPPLSFESPEKASENIGKAKEKAEAAAEGIKRHASENSSEISSDSRTLIEALKTLCSTLLTSSVFRLILADAISIIRELVANAAYDVDSAALKVHEIAENVEYEAKHRDLGIHTDFGEDLKLRRKASELVGDSTTAARETAADVKQSLEEKKEAWKNVKTDVEEDAKRIFLNRVEEMVVRAQQDPSSRRAILAILTIVRKYAHKFTLAAEDVIENVQEAAAADDERQAQRSQLSTNEKEVPTGFADPYSYPPQPYGPPPIVLIPGVKITSPQLEYVLRDAKKMGERIAQGHSLDSMLKALGELVKHSIAAPGDIGESVRKLAHEKIYVNMNDSINLPGSSKQTRNIPEDAKHENEEKNTENVFMMYFSKVGMYLEKAVIEPGWATSTQGRRALETLYDATHDLAHVVGEVIVGTAEIVEDGVEQAEEKMNGEGIKIEKGKGIDKGQISQGNKQRERSNQWARDFIAFFDQLREYIDGIEKDKTTMRLVNALETLREDVKDLFDEGKEKVQKATESVRSTTQRQRTHTGGGKGMSRRKKLGVYTQWLGWALPYLLKLLPLDAIPVPRVEIKTNSVDAAVDALWIRGAALRSGIGTGFGTYGSNNRQRANVPGMRPATDEGGIAGKLVPDFVIIRQWTEVRVLFAEGTGVGGVGAWNAKRTMQLMGEGRKVPGIEATSRLRVYVDGIKACAKGMGYYFRYNGSLFSYEDEGVLGIDLGTVSGGRRHLGLGMDIQLEMDSEDVEMDMSAGRSMAGLPLLVVEDVDTSSVDMPRSLEGFPSAGRDESAGQLGTLPMDPSKIPVDVALANVVPLFRVVDVRVDLRRMKFRIDESKHWIFNKLIVEPFAGDIVAGMARRTLEERMRKALEALAKGMGLILMEAEERANNRRVRILTQKRDVKRKIEASWEREMAEEDGKLRPSDVWAVLLERGPQLLTYYTQAEPGAKVTTQSHTELTRKGVVYSAKQTIKTEQPGLRAHMTIIPPPGMINEEGNVEASLIRGSDEIGGEAEAEEITVSVGGGAQLFPGKGGPSGVNKDAGGEQRSIRDDLRKGIGRAKEELREMQKGSKEMVEGVRDAKDCIERGKEDGRRTVLRERQRGSRDWRSAAFDF